MHPFPPVPPCTLMEAGVDAVYHIPSLDDTTIAERLFRLLTGGVLRDHELVRRIDRLGERFAVYRTTCPLPFWTPDLVISDEMEAITETYLPFAEIAGALRRLLNLAVHQRPAGVAVSLSTSRSWLDFLRCLDSPFQELAPARLLTRLVTDGDLRQRFIFALALPRHFGNAFGRYPRQAAFLRHWFATRSCPQPINCLDAACGSGEGTYDLARLLLEAGYAPPSFAVLGTTHDPIELFAAAHAFFPHDAARQEQFRRSTAELHRAGAAARMRFAVEDLLRPTEDTSRFDVIVCNGILGGPFINARGELERVIGGLAGRLAPKGIFLAADRFHEGWRRIVPPQLLADLLAGAGLTVQAAGEGLAGVRSG